MGSRDGLVGVGWGSILVTLVFCFDEGLTLKTSANTLFTAFSISTSTGLRLIHCQLVMFDTSLKLMPVSQRIWTPSPSPSVQIRGFGHHHPPPYKKVITSEFQEINVN